MTEGKEAFALAERLKDDTVWKTANLTGLNVPYDSASTVALKGIGLKGRPVEETILLYRLANAWDTMLANPNHPLDGDMFDCYRTILGSPEGIRSPERMSSPTEETAIEEFIRIYPKDPLLAAICANHLLVNGNIGLLAVYPRQSNELKTRTEDGDSNWIGYHAIELLPGGLTRERMKEYGR
ncbi:hypothetical protein [Bifidobacterium sp. SO1]|uniref:hypothetical protein n=1 Tax=Bifidobacterium sp. SO1 TaxID=2809029 RepID=UPI001BDCBBB6|nr:hypothetical protein [Bifidobacterium sp. SO1]MBT1162782.1 hypothetical protein [Bifidobacterium sp. SO1]